MKTIEEATANPFIAEWMQRDMQEKRQMEIEKDPSKASTAELKDAIQNIRQEFRETPAQDQATLTTLAEREERLREVYDTRVIDRQHQQSVGIGY